MGVCLTRALRLFVALLLSSLEQLIVGTALTAISSDLGQYDKSVWVVTAYLMTYNGPQAFQLSSS